MDDIKCQGNHTEHICVMAKGKKFDKIMTVVRNPKFICFNCGRVSEFKENLCNPELIK